MGTQIEVVATPEELRDVRNKYIAGNFAVIRDEGTSVTLARRKPFNWLLAIVCLFVPVIGWVALVVMIAASGRGSEVIEIRLQRLGDEGKVLPAISYDLKMWKVLVEVDDEIRAATETVRLYGQEYVDRLADQYLTLNDKSHLPALVSKLIDSAKAVRKTREQSDYLREMCTRVQDLYVAPAGNLIIFKDWSIVADVNGSIQKFASPDDYRKKTNQRDAMWDEVKDEIQKQQFIEQFRAYWPVR